jgi:DNA-binding transcriptional ArsR family regulator
MTDLVQRIERIERLLGVGTTGGGEPPAPAAPAQEQRNGIAEGSLGDWVRRKRTRPSEVVVGIAASVSVGGVATASQVFERPEVRFDLRHMAGLYQAFASETRLAMMRELFIGGDRSTAELMEAVGLDRGQLYHHLRDLFVQGLVRQPVRGRYTLTGRGTYIFLGAGVVATLFGGDGPSIPFEPDEPTQESAAPAPRAG